MKKLTRVTAMALAGLMTMGCAAAMVPAAESDEIVTIKFMHKGPEPDNWDAVYAEYEAKYMEEVGVALDITWVEHADYKDKLNLEITSGNEWDLVFDASWVQLKNLAPEHYYADLSSYFNNPDEYPGLAAAFSEDVMKANIWFDQMCYIPLFETYGNGIPVVWYRKDWAKDWGVGTDGQINSYEEMEAYWQAAKDAGLIAYGASQARGFFQQLSIRGEAHENENGNTAAAGVQQFSSAGLTVWTYVKDGELVSYAVEGSGDEAFADFPEGWNYDFGADRYEKFAEWQDAGYIDPDSLSVTDYATPFEAGLNASIVGTLDDYVGNMKYVDSWKAGGDEDAELGYFIYVDSIRNMEAGAIPTDRSGNNGLAIPATSTKIDATMKFLDWMFGSQEAHDLIQYGLEGVDFAYGEIEGTVDVLTDYNSQFGGYGMTWNPTYALLGTYYDEQTLTYRQYEYTEDSFITMPITGFRFDTSDVDLSTAVAQCKAVTDMVATVKLHGIKTDGYGNSYDTMEEMLKANVEEALANGGQEVVDAMIAQLKEHLAK
ncbi:MAG: extracellular solute-binding protein [Lachnospiraceae bacterium]|nr:extracellular solute-binding protein [Lachnospiraceae bacterium]